MLSYLHQYHAGNHADVLKHWLLLECLAYLAEKPAGFTYFDTHAGWGQYSLRGPAAREAQAGVLAVADWRESPLGPYAKVAAQAAVTGTYPGSPVLAAQRLRPVDRGFCFELHPRAFSELEQSAAAVRPSFTYCEDGPSGLLARLPVASGRALTLIDPSYERLDEYRAIAGLARSAWRKMPQMVGLIWYPLVARAPLAQFFADLRRAGLREVVRLEMELSPGGEGLYGSGVIGINLPWRLPELAATVLPALAEKLAPAGRPRVHVGAL